MSAVYDRALDAELDRTLERARDIQSMRQRASKHLEGYSVRRAFSELAHDRRSGYFEAEISRDLERMYKQPCRYGGLLMPWEIATRADIVGTGSAGGYLGQTLNITAMDALRPAMATGGLGATYIDAPYGASVNQPRQTAAGTAAWLPTETSAVSETDQQFGQISYTPHTVASYTEISRQITLQAAPSPAEFVVRRDLIATVARALDLAAFFGSGISGQPLGLAHNSGVTTFSGTTLSLTSLINAATALGDGMDDSCGVATTKVIAGLLRTRPESTGSTRCLWEGNLIAGSVIGFPARSSSQLTSGSLFLGSFRYLNIVTWGNLEIAANPYGDLANASTNFQKGLIGVRAFLTCDAAPTWPTAFGYASSVT